MLYHGKSIEEWLDVMRSGEKGRDEAGATPALDRTLATDPDVAVRLRAAQALTGIAGLKHSAAVNFLRQTARSLNPTLAQWIKQDAKLILKDAGISE